MTVAVIAGGPRHYPSIRELEAVASALAEHGCTTVRVSAERGTARLVGAYLKARGLAAVDAAKGGTPVAEMLDGEPPDLLGETPRPRASLVITLAGDVAPVRIAAAARGVRAIDVLPVAEPRPWNRHHGDPPGPSVYVGRGTPLGNQDPNRADRVGVDLETYRWLLWDRIRPGSPAYDPEAVAMLDAMTPDHYAVCSCWPGPCHAAFVIAGWRFRQMSHREGVW